MKPRPVFLAIGWTAAAAWAVLWIYVRATSRWGVFAVAPAILPLLAVSVVIALYAGLAFVIALWKGRWDLPYAVLGALHGGIVWLASVRR